MARIVTFKDVSKKEVITQKASALFRNKGFSATSMRDIANTIGVEAPSLYNHIKSKNEILIDICFKVAKEFTGNLKNIENSGGSFLFKLESIIRFHITMMIDNFENIYISDHEWKHLPEPFLTDYKNQRRNYRSRLAAILKKGMNNKEINSVNPDVAVLMVLSSIGGIENWHRSGKKISAKALEKSMVKILIEGLRRK